MNGRHTGSAEPHRSKLALLTVVVTIVAAAVVLFGLGYRELELSGNVRQPGPSASMSTSAARGTPNACVIVGTAQRNALTEADRAIVQWHKHIDAMNALFGMRTEFEQAMRDWDRDRSAADQSVSAFQNADAKYRKLLAEYGPCSGENNAGEAMLMEARKSVGRWSGDIKDAKDLRADRITCPDAAAKWKRTDVVRMSDLSRYEGARAVYDATGVTAGWNAPWAGTRRSPTAPAPARPPW
jgi:hypothetical protein